MSDGVFVGRDAELARATGAVDRALSGRGSLLCLVGEAGIGKTRLADGVASMAASRGARVVWGRAWEAGGAPSYWPWIQVFRALGIDDGPFTATDASSSSDAQHARFRRFDRAVESLKQACGSPLVIVLDDLHAADVPSLLVLSLLVRDLRGMQLLLVATYREADARLEGVDAVLTKIAREGETLSLGRLTRSDVRAWMRASSPESGDTDAESVHRTTEGNPLFVCELLRTRGWEAAITGASLPDGLRAVLTEHVGRVSVGSRAILECASVLGREMDGVSVAVLAEQSIDDVAAAFREGATAGLLTVIAGGERARFTHILVREQLYETLVPSRRAALHRRAGERIVATRGDLATAAHHLLAGRDEGSALRAAEIALEAAKETLAKLAFEDATRLCKRALEAHEADDAVTCELELLLGEARLRSGEIASGKEVCLRVSARAKRMGSPLHVARAALVFATELVTGRVDPVMVALLRDALASLETRDDPVRARVMARLAASLVPPLDGAEVPALVALGREGIAMARRLGDPDTLLFTLHYGAAAFGYLVSSSERYEGVAEIVSLAETVGRPLVRLNVGGPWIATLREHGRLDEAARAMAQLESLVGEFEQPHYRWRMPMLRAIEAWCAGDHDEAARLNEEGLAIAERGDVRTGVVCWALNRASFALLRDEPAAIAKEAGRLVDVLSRIATPNGFVTWILAASGQREQARAQLPELTENTFHYPWALMGGETATLLGDVDHAARLYEPLRAHALRNPIFWGPFGCNIFGPAQRVAADVAALLGRTEEARALYDEAIALGERMRAVPIVALATKRRDALTPTLSPGGERGPAADSPGRPGGERGPEVDSPRRRGGERGPEVDSPGRPGGERVGVRAIEITRDGATWRVSSSTGICMHLADAKGFAYLAELLRRPGNELHVTQLADVGEISGDAGVVLDERAKRQYRERLEALRDGLEEATRFGDAARAERARTEIDALAEQLASAVGLGGRDRKAGSHVERARVNVQRRLRDAIARIEKHDPTLGRYLAATVRTGVFCSFTPL